MDERTPKQALPAGYRLQNYRIENVLGVGGFGVTYLASHATLGHRVAIKEYLPNEFAVRDGTTVYAKSTSDRTDFEWGLARFLDEAKTLARFEHRNVVRVRDYFEANHTAYIVMDYEDGEPLDRLLDRHGTLTEAQLRRVLLPVVDGLREVHAAGFLHRDIKPSNVFVRREDESPVLLDFGAARQALGRKSRSLTAVASAGYSPPEQYESEGEQGAWTDIYALSALCYRAIRGESPVEAPRRLNRMAQGQADPLAKLGDLMTEGFSGSFLEAIDQGLELAATRRPANLDDWLVRLTGAGTTERPPPTGRGAVGRTPRSRKGRRAGRFVGLAAVVAATAVGAWWWIQSDGAIPDRGGISPAGQQSMADVAPPLPTVDAMPDLLGGNALLVVRTEPPGAEVFVRDTSVGESPLERSDILAGAHPITIRRANYQDERLDRDFADGEVTSIDLALTRAVGKLTVVLQPRNAWIERDGERLAETTPVTLSDLPAGPLELRLGAAEHRSIVARVDIPGDGVARLERALEPIPYGSLTLEVIPSDATVTLPDIAPPYRPGMRLPEGGHRVTLRKAGFLEATHIVTVAGDTQERIELELDLQPFTVVATPATASVELMDVEEAYRPGIPLPFGEYRIRVTAPEHGVLEETVVHGTEPTLHEVSLVRLPQPFTVEVTPAEATVELADLDEPYRPGMRLPPGEYVVRTGAEGYVAHEETVRHGQEPTRFVVVLESAIPAPGERFSDTLATGGKGPEMVVIPAGSFRMGCVSGRDCYDSERPVHTVTFPNPFALSVYEVTFADWDACTRLGGCNRYRPDDEGWGRGHRPVINVSWDDAQAYVAWLSRETGSKYRLPSESEWEHAARAGTATRYSWGDAIGRNRANCDGCDSKWDNHSTSPVGSFAANPWGLYDVHGNVMEWLADCWNDRYRGAPSDGISWLRGDCRQRVLRGGCWGNNPRSLRAANRYRAFTWLRTGVIGFRVARTLTP